MPFPPPNQSTKTLIFETLRTAQPALCRHGSPFRSIAEGYGPMLAEMAQAAGKENPPLSEACFEVVWRARIAVHDISFLYTRVALGRNPDHLKCPCCFRREIEPKRHIGASSFDSDQLRKEKEPWMPFRMLDRYHFLSFLVGRSRTMSTRYDEAQHW